MQVKSVIPPFKENELSFWVPGVLCQHSEVVLWKLLSIQMTFWWIFLGGKWNPCPIPLSSWDRPLLSFLYGPTLQLSSVQFSHSVMSDSLRPHGLQHARPPCPSPTPGVYPNSCPLNWWCHPTISSSVTPFSSRLQSFPESGSFQTLYPYMTTGKTIHSFDHTNFCWQSNVSAF